MFPSREEMEMFRSIVRGLVLSLLAAALALPALSAVIDPGFTQTSYITIPGGNMTGMAWAPDGSGRLFVMQKGGTVRIVQAGSPPTLLPASFAVVTPIFTSSECGLIGMAFDPSYLDNRYVYFFVTVSNNEQQIIRYIDVSNVGQAKTTVMANLPTQGINHDGGGIGFGADGKLYWSIGDNGSGIGVNADLTSLASKVGRAWVEGTVPLDNPFRDGAGPNNDYIWARGVRNPFTMTFQPATGRLWVDVTGGSYEQVFAPLAGDHCGWNTYENNQPAGFITPLIKYRTNGTDTRTIAAGGAVRTGNVATFTTTATHGFRQGEKITISGVADPTFNGSVYVSSTPTATTFTAAQAGTNASSGGGSAVTQALGGALTGGAFYDGTQFPGAYRGNFFFADLNGQDIIRAAIKTGTTVTSVDKFSQDTDSAIDVAPGTDGALYHVLYGGEIRRTAWIPAAQGLVLSDTHLLIHEGHQVAFAVSLATAPAAPVSVSIARTSGSADVNVVSGGTLVFTPANYSVPQAVRLKANEDDDLIQENAIVSVSSTGLTTETVSVNVLDLTGASGTPGPGRVPDGGPVPGTPLTVTKSVSIPGALDLAWGASCAPGATDYAVYQGTLGSWYSHVAVLCSTAGARTTTITPPLGNRYYLVVPMDDQSEGSYGTASSGAERPRPGSQCRTQRNTTPCS
jgi:glucose/arabinose dehydrogenase